MNKSIVAIVLATITLQIFGQEKSSVPQTRAVYKQEAKPALAYRSRVDTLKLLHDFYVVRSIKEVSKKGSIASASDKQWLNVSRMVTDEADNYQIITRNSASGALRFVYITTYDLKTRQLIGWSSVKFDNQGRTEILRHLADFRGQQKEAPLVITDLVIKNFQGKLVVTESKGQRKHQDGDPMTVNPYPKLNPMISGMQGANQPNIASLKIPTERWAQLKKVFEASLEQEHLRLADELREAAGIGTRPELTSVGMPNKANNRLPDPSALPQGQRPAENENLGVDKAITNRLQRPRERSSVVGPGSASRDPLGLVSYFPSVETSITHQGGSTRVRTTIRDFETGATQGIFITSYSDETNLLTGWSATTVDGLGNTRTEQHTVEYRGPEGHSPVVITEIIKRDGHGNEIARERREERPLTGSDPGVVNPNPPTDGSMTGDEVSGRGPLGAECNPITGQCKYTMKLGNNQVNPGKDAQPALTGPRIKIDPQDAVVNPDPNKFQGNKQPTRIDTIRVGPGGMPVPPVMKKK